jgi:hypothetical protein
MKEEKEEIDAPMGLMEALRNCVPIKTTIRKSGNPKTILIHTGLAGFEMLSKILPDEKRST